MGYISRGYTHAVTRSIFSGTRPAPAQDHSVLISPWVLMGCPLGRWGGGRTHLLLTLVISPRTTHPHQDGAPFLLLTEIPPTFGRSLCFFRMSHIICLLILSTSCFAVYGHHLSPRTAIVFSLLSSLSNSSISHTSNVLIFSSNASRSSLYISHSPTM